MTYEQIWSWVYENFDVNNYWIPEDLIYDVKNAFTKTNSPFPVQAEELIRERFQYRREYAEMEARQAEQKQIAEYIGSGTVLESLSDEIVDDLKSPRSEIMDIDMTQYTTTKETVVPPEIQKFYQTRQTFIGRLAGTFKRIFFRK
jgi:hypothetical protein